MNKKIMKKCWKIGENWPNYWKKLKLGKTLIKMGNMSKIVKRWLEIELNYEKKKTLKIDDNS